MGRDSPRPVSLALQSIIESAAPKTPLAAVQSVWAEVVGDGIAAVSEPVSEREGTLTVECQSTTWAAELDLMQSELKGRLEERLGDQAPAVLRFRAGQPTSP